MRQRPSKSMRVWTEWAREKQRHCWCVSRTRMLNTSYVEGEQSISDKLNLSPPQIATVASNLFLQTNGHPRTILSVLQNCTTFDALLTFKTTLPLELRGLDWNILFEGLARNRVTIVRFLEKMEKNEVMDLTEEVKDAGGRLSTLDAIASNACIAWDGTLEEAELHVHPFVESHMQNYAMPFQKYIQAVGNVSETSSDYSTVFQWMFLKRFQEVLFQSKNTPQLPPSALSPFFDTPLFGKLNAIEISKLTRKIPKVTTNGSRHPSLDSLTMHPQEWKNLMPLIDALGCVCLKPLPKSSSSDAFLIGKSLEYPEQRLTVGLAVKNYKSTKFNAGQLDDECHVFNRMFDGVDCKSRKNVLFICSTSYTEDIARKFHSRHCQVYNAAIFPNISEVVLLDLSTPALRALFFGLVVGSDLSVFVENVVKKAEVEFNAELQ
ncbi:hypothetical protein BDR26DRAFT_594579 [Obelidium mucronatum]|nr:hypothetical protein BDR26DRAFT_594579 [Obelidium mucronatum]